MHNTTIIKISTLIKTNKMTTREISDLLNIRPNRALQLAKAESVLFRECDLEEYLKKIESFLNEN